MKLILIVLTLSVSLITSKGFAQEAKPETVYSVVKVYKTYEWYSEQYALWVDELKKNKRNQDAWKNRYAAARMAKITAKEDSLRNDWYAKMESTIADMEKSISKTYTYYHLKSWHSSIWGSSKEEVEEIMSWSEKAYTMDPERPDIYPDIMNNVMISGDREKTTELSKKWLASGDLSPNLMAMTYNMLMSVEDNAILLTCGDNDTYPALALQYGQGIRKDVTVINIFCAWGSKSYSDIQFEKCGLPKAAVGTFNSEKDVVDYVLKNQSDNPIYFAYGDYLNANEDLNGKTYNVGLAIKYCENDFNNTSVLIHNFEQKFLLDQLKFDLYQERFPEQAKRHNLSYIPGLMILYDHYKVVGDVQKQNATRNLIERLIADTSYEETIGAKLNETN